MILIALVGWKEPTEAQFVEVNPGTPGATRYASLWVSADKDTQQMTNTVFVFYAMSLHYEILRTPRLTNEVFSQYEGIAHFSADMHHVFLQARAEPQRQCFKLPYVVTELDIQPNYKYTPQRSS